MKQPDLSVEIAGIHLKNPVMSASGCYGYGKEYADFYDIEQLGALVVKGTTLEPREGNCPPRIVETSSGILNSVGLQNPGVEHFIREEVPRFRESGIPLIVNIAGNLEEEYFQLAARLDQVEEVKALEVNISCPNVKKGGMAFGTDVECAFRLVKEVRSATSKPLIVKLSPNVTDIVGVALAVQEAGADALSLINTLLGMAIDIHRRKPVLGNVMGGLSGPAVKPVALRMVWQVSEKVEIPVVGMGGIMTAEDALEFILAGASAVAVGTANFVNPLVIPEIIKGIADYMIDNNISQMKELIGAARKGE